jgi:23S rRNA pseudouridine1911/1915/1917 synthase
MSAFPLVPPRPHGPELDAADAAAADAAAADDDGDLPLQDTPAPAVASDRVLQVRIGADPPPRLDKAIARDAPEAAGLSRMRIARAIADGDVCRAETGEALTRPSARVVEGECLLIRLAAPSAPADMLAEPIALRILHEDGDLIVIDKPAGMVVHPAPGAPRGTLVNALLHHCGPDLLAIGGAGRPGIVHRIDKDTTGLLVVAKTESAHRALSAQFAAHSVQRHYLALVHGLPDPAQPRLRGLPGISMEAGGLICIRTGLDRHPTDRQRQAVTFAGGRAAVTRARVLAGWGTPPALALVECRLETGRTHQIRVHMAHAGHPLVGDATYGNRRRAPARSLGPGLAAAVDGFARQALHAASLGFTHPASGALLHFSSPLPPDLAALMALADASAGHDARPSPAPATPRPARR